MKNLAAVTLAKRRKGIKEKKSPTKRLAAIRNLRKAWEQRKKPEISP